MPALRPQSGQGHSTCTALQLLQRLFGQPCNSVGKPGELKKCPQLINIPPLEHSQTGKNQCTSRLHAPPLPKSYTRSTTIRVPCSRAFHPPIHSSIFPSIHPSIHRVELTKTYNFYKRIHPAMGEERNKQQPFGRNSTAGKLNSSTSLTPPNHRHVRYHRCALDTEDTDTNYRSHL